MSDGAISQEEIDALLSGVTVDGLNSSGHVGSGPSYKFDVPTLQKMADELKPKLEDNINKYTGAKFSVGNPVTEEVNRDRVLAKLPEVVIGVIADYNAGIKGNHFYLLSSEFALKLHQLVSNEDNTEVDDMVLSVVSEFVSTHIGAEINILDATGKVPGLSYATPKPINESKAMVMFPQQDFVLISYPLTLDKDNYTLWECIGGDAAEAMTNALGGNIEEPVPLDVASPDMSSKMENPMQQNGMSQQMNVMPNMGMQQMNMQQPMMQNMGMNMGGMQQPMMQNMGMNMGGMQQPMMQNMGMNMGTNVPNVQSLQFPSLQQGGSNAEQGNIGLIMDVFMEMTVELGRTKKSIKDILGMGEGTIIELDKLAGEPVDILVNHKPIAKGEVVVIDENFGVRVTEILSPIERVNDIS